MTSDSELSDATAGGPLTPHKTNRLSQSAATPRKALISTPVKSVAVAKPRERLTIHKIVLINFKSYAGVVEIGPFDVSFSSIVGPNGSGKSNTIDALLFVFGWRASKMRQGKLSELIHNSEGKMDLDFCSVEIHFREIIDLTGPQKYKVVEGSDLIVARTAFRNNSSKYLINKKTSNFTEVTTLLKGKGIDLDHKRFLILQGEVESIAQMKPKAPNEHEDGLLEYLEDIIGTSNFKEPIEKASEQVDQLNETRGEKLNRVRLVEAEKKALEPRKREADEFLRDQNRHSEASSKLYQVYRYHINEAITTATAEAEQQSQLLEAERASQADIRQAADESQKDFEEVSAGVKVLEVETKKIEKELAVFDQKDAQLQEELKHHSTKQKKLKKSIIDDTHAKNESNSESKNRKEEVAKFAVDIEKLEKTLGVEEVELDKIRDSLKDKTEGISAQIMEKQAELQPWAEKVSKVTSNRSIAQSELQLLEDRASSAQRAIDEAQTTLASLKVQTSTTKAEIEQLNQEKVVVETTIKEESQHAAELQKQSENAMAKAANLRNKVDEARSSQNARTTQNKVLADLSKLAQQGRLTGFYGRLGDLGRIDDKYDVAVSTAAPGLNNLVCETVKTGQECLDHLRKSRSGRATIMCLDQVAKRDLARKDTPENVPRLFDLITPKDEKFAPVFYEAIKDTLVAKDMDQARRLAYGVHRRWRVVTLQGQLIDTSGTMSGGGQRVAKGLMSSKIAVDDFTPEAVAQLEKDQQQADQELLDLQSRHTDINSKLQELRKKPREMDARAAKLELTLRSCIKRSEESNNRISELSSQLNPEAGDVDRIAVLNEELKLHQKDLSFLTGHTSQIEQQVKELQDQIMAIGGTKLRVQSTKVTDIKARIDLASDRMTKAQVAGNKAEKDFNKYEKAIATNTKALEEAEEALAKLTKRLRDNSKASETYRSQVSQANELLEQRREQLLVVKAELEQHQEKMKEFRKLEIKIEQKRDKLLSEIKENEKKRRHWQEKLDMLDMHDIDEDDEEDEEIPKASDKEQAPDSLAAEDGQESTGAATDSHVKSAPQKTLTEQPVLRDYSADELQEMDVDELKSEVAILEERLDKAKPNLQVLQEYKRREKEWQERVADLESVTKERDGAKKLYEDLRKQRLDQFMEGFNQISLKLKEMYQMITMGGNAELELVDSLDPFSEGIVFSVMPPKKSWKHISNLSGGEKTLSSLALVFALHVFKPTPLYFMDEIDAALDFRNVSIVAGYIAQRTKNAQFIIISLRNNMFELAARLVGIYKTANCTKSVTIANSDIKKIATV